MVFSILSGRADAKNTPHLQVAATLRFSRQFRYRDTGNIRICRCLNAPLKKRTALAGSGNLAVFPAVQIPGCRQYTYPYVRQCATEKSSPRGAFSLFIQAYIFNKIIKFTAAADEVYKIALEAAAANGVEALISVFIADEYGV